MPVVVVVRLSAPPREPLDGSRMREEERVDEARRIEIREVRVASRRNAASNAPGSCVSSSAKRSARRSSRRENAAVSGSDATSSSPQTSSSSGMCRGVGSAATRRARRARRSPSRDRSLRDVAMPAVPELVRDDDLELGLLRLVEQRVETTMRRVLPIPET